MSVNKHVARADVGTPTNIKCEGVTIDDENVERLSYAPTSSGHTEKGALISKLQKTSLFDQTVECFTNTFKNV